MKQIKTRLFYIIPVLVALIGVCFAIQINAGPDGERSEHAGVSREIPAAQAYRMWQSNPENVKILDVRTTAEYALVGHPPMAYNIPLATWTGAFDPSRRIYTMQNNPDFLDTVEKRFSREDTLLLLCRSGFRSGIAARQLMNAGFKRVYNIVDGFEGNPPSSKSNILKGCAGESGWKHSGAPWTYELDPQRVYSP